MSDKWKKPLRLVEVVRWEGEGDFREIASVDDRKVLRVRGPDGKMKRAGLAILDQPGAPACDLPVVLSEELLETWAIKLRAIVEELEGSLSDNDARLVRLRLLAREIAPNPIR